MRNNYPQQACQGHPKVQEIAYEKFPPSEPRSYVAHVSQVLREPLLWSPRWNLGEATKVTTSCLVARGVWLWDKYYVNG